MFGRLKINTDEAFCYPTAVTTVDINQVKSFEDFIYLLLQKSSIIYYNGSFVYMDQLCIDLEKGEVYLPFTKGKVFEPDNLTESEYKHLLKYNHKPIVYYDNYIEKLYLMKLNKDTLRYERTVKDLTILGVNQGHLQLIKFNIPDELPLIERTDKENKSMMSLYQRYLVACAPENGNVSKQIFKSRYNFITPTINKILKRNNLNVFTGYYNEPNYPFISHDIADIKESYPAIIKLAAMPLVVRRLTFLLSLVFDVCDTVKYTDTDYQYDDLRNNKCFYIKYGRAKYPLVITRDILFPKQS